MNVEFIGMIGTQVASEIHPPKGPVIDPDYVCRFARAHEDNGFDRILVGYFSNGPDGFIVASYAAWATERLGLMLAHRPGFVAPTLAARKLATLDHFSGRIPIGPFRHPRDPLGARPGEAFAADTDAVAHRLRVVQDEVKKRALGIDDHGARRLAAGVVDYLPDKSAGTISGFWRFDQRRRGRQRSRSRRRCMYWCRYIYRS